MSLERWIAFCCAANSWGENLISSSVVRFSISSSSSIDRPFDEDRHHVPTDRTQENYRQGLRFSTRGEHNAPSYSYNITSWMGSSFWWPSHSRLPLKHVLIVNLLSYKCNESLRFIWFCFSTIQFKCIPKAVPFTDEQIVLKKIRIRF